MIDSSAILAVLLAEPEAEMLSQVIADDPTRFMSGFSLLESSVVIEARKGEAGGRELDLLLHRTSVRIVDVSAEQIEIAREAWRRFGRGRHAAALNIGDCCSYALARSLGEALLFKGDDFSKTDITVVPYG